MDAAYEGSDEAQAALAARYRSAAPAAAGPWNDTVATMLAHKSVRAFLPDALPAGLIERVVAAAQSAPTSSNMQTWSVIAVEDPARKARLAVIAGNQRHILQCPLLLVWVADHSRVRTLAAAAQAQSGALDYLEAFLVAAIDAALAAQNAVVALESLRLGTVYIGALRNDPQAVAVELGLPAGAAAMFGLCVGYADPAATSAVKPRLPQAAVLHRERYDATAAQRAFAGYDRDMLAFQAEQGMTPVGWTKTALARFRDAAALNGRDALRGALDALGFPIR